MSAVTARIIAIVVLAAVAGIALLASASAPKLRGSIDAHGNPVFPTTPRTVSKGE